jgi:catechol 2,3-dioxygenase
VPLLHLEAAPDANPDDSREAGLYHTAFLMPTRADLARWILHVARSRVPISGASDHTVSEAFYLDDPEGNGVEVYADRDPNGWEWTGELVKITTDPLDIDAIVREVDPQTAGFDGAPDGLRIGHIHLRVGDVAAAERFYRDGVGFKVTRGGRHGASFMSTGRYHHHLAGNVWHSRGAGPRDPERAGLAWFAIEATEAADLDAIARRLTEQGAAVATTAAGLEAADPWGTRVRFVRA